MKIAQESESGFRRIVCNQASDTAMNQQPNPKNKKEFEYARMAMQRSMHEAGKTAAEIRKAVKEFDRRFPRWTDGKNV